MKPVHPEYVLYVSSSHWDREWYLSFQSFRFRLVEVFEKVLDTLENDTNFSTFILDGQTIILEDYLEIRPHEKERIGKLIEGGRLVVGPWYTMPDENLSSGESLIQNLTLGHALSGSFAAGKGTMKYGFVCDVFGHIAQMPQIFNGFGIKGALLGRGTNNFDCPAHFIWQSPDRSECITFKVPESLGYGTYWNDVLRPYASGEDGIKENILQRTDDYIEMELDRSGIPIVVLMDNMDHTGINTDAPWICDYIKKKYGCAVEIGNIPGLLDRLEVHRKQLPVKTGELQKTVKEMVEHNKLISNTLSSRYDMKRLNDKAEALLERSALPLAALANLYGDGLPSEFIKTAYQFLVQNQTHDSICGCSLDEVHRDMMFRFNQALNIGDEICEFSLKTLLSPMFESKKDDSNIYLLTGYNPLPYAVNRAIIAEIDFEKEYPFTFDDKIPSEAINQFRVIDADGKEIAYHITDIDKDAPSRVPRELYPTKRERYKIVFYAELPAMGYATYKIEPSALPVRYFASLKTGDTIAENSHIILEIDSLGRIHITNKKTMQSYQNILQYCDSGETGDGWFHRPSVPDRIVHNAGTVRAVETVLDAPDMCTFRIVQEFLLPEAMDYHRRYTRRSHNDSAVQVVSYLTIDSTSPYVSCEVTVNNTVKDHYFKLSMPTGIDSEDYYASQAFTFVKRASGRDASTHNWQEAEKIEKSFGGIVYRANSDHSGFAFISGTGLHECAVKRGREGRIDISLLRTFSKTFTTSGQVDGQLLGEQTFAFALFPFASGTSNAELMRIKDGLQTSFKTYTTPGNEKTKAVKETQGYAIEGTDCHVSLIKPAMNGTVIRIVNYGDKPATANIQSMKPILEAHLADMLDRPGVKIKAQKNTLTTTLNPHEIQTMLIRHNENDKA